MQHRFFILVLEAIEVVIEMGGGPATVSTRFALQVVEYYKESGVMDEV